MVTEKDIKSKSFRPLDTNKVSYRVTPKSMSRFSENQNELWKKLRDYLEDYKEENNLSWFETAGEVEERCKHSWDGFKKYLSNRKGLSRAMLYKFCIGMELSLEESKELFAMSKEGGLSDDNMGDYIFMCAIRDGDDIDSFISQYEEYTGKKISKRNRSE